MRMGGTRDGSPQRRVDDEQPLGRRRQLRRHGDSAVYRKPRAGQPHPGGDGSEGAPRDRPPSSRNAHAQPGRVFDAPIRPPGSAFGFTGKLVRLQKVALDRIRATFASRRSPVARRLRNHAARGTTGRVESVNDPQGVGYRGRWPPGGTGGGAWRGERYSRTSRLHPREGVAPATCPADRPSRWPRADSDGTLVARIDDGFRGHRGTVAASTASRPVQSW